MDRKRQFNDADSPYAKRQALTYSSAPSAAPYHQPYTQQPPYNQPQSYNVIAPDQPLGTNMGALRVLITPKEAGVVIGKQGRHIAEIRDKTGAKVIISGQVSLESCRCVLK